MKMSEPALNVKTVIAIIRYTIFKHYLFVLKWSLIAVSAKEEI